MFDLLSGLFSPHKVKKRVIVSANDAITGAYVNMKLHEYNDDKGKIVASVVGSASVPFFFPPRNMSEYGDDTLLIDGGTSWNNNLVSGVEECLKMDGIHSHEQIDVDIISLDGTHLANFTDPRNSSLYEPATM